MKQLWEKIKQLWNKLTHKVKVPVVEVKMEPIIEEPKLLDYVALHGGRVGGEKWIADWKKWRHYHE